jgi:hypothetical protein
VNKKIIPFIAFGTFCAIAIVYASYQLFAGPACSTFCAFLVFVALAFVVVKVYLDERKKGFTGV